MVSGKVIYCKSLAVVFLFFNLTIFAQEEAIKSYNQVIINYQDALNEQYSSPEKSPLSKKDIIKFKGHDFFDINSNYKVIAKFEKFENPTTFLMKTSSDRLPEYEKYGTVTFKLFGNEFKLNVYKSLSSYDNPDYVDDLFLPFTDLTNGNETYYGGRYLDLTIPSDNTIIIDFNKSYNPYCAYSHNYSCPIPPEENHIPFRIEAGILKSNLK